MQMLLVMEFYLADFANGSLFEPGKLSVWQKQLFIPDENPKAIRRNICHFNAESADAMRCVCHGATSLSGKGLRCTSPLQSTVFMVLSGIHGLVILMNNTQISNGSETA